MTLAEIADASSPGAALVACIAAEGRVAVVDLRGEADVFTAPVVVDVLARVIADFDGAVIVDLSNTEFIDSTVAFALERAREFLDDRGRTLTLRSPSRMAARLLALLELSHLIEPDRVNHVAFSDATATSHP